MGYGALMTVKNNKLQHFSTRLQLKMILHVLFLNNRSMYDRADDFFLDEWMDESNYTDFKQNNANAFILVWMVAVKLHIFY